MKKSAIAALVLAATAVPALAQQAMKPEDQIKTRKAAMAVIGYNFGSLGAMAQGKKPYDQAESEINADAVSAVAVLPKRFFGEGTSEGHDTKAKAGIWEHRADFDEKMDKFIAEAQKLPAAARAGEDALKKQVGDTGKACKACHDDYRAK